MVSVWPKHRITTLVLGTLVMMLGHPVIADELDYCAKRYPSITSYKPPPNFSLERREKIDITNHITTLDLHAMLIFDVDFVYGVQPVFES